MTQPTTKSGPSTRARGVMSISTTAMIARGLSATPAARGSVWPMALPTGAGVSPAPGRLARRDTLRRGPPAQGPPGSVAQMALLALAAGYARLRRGGGGAGVPGACEVAWVEGPDALGFLQGLLTNDVLALAVGGSEHALLLNAKGRIQADLRVARTA